MVHGGETRGAQRGFDAGVADDPSRPAAHPVHHPQPPRARSQRIDEPGQRPVPQPRRAPVGLVDEPRAARPLGEDGCSVELRMRFEFSAAVPGALFEPLFEETAASLVDAFVERAREVYGR